MVLCLIVGCGIKSGRDKGLLTVVKNQGEEAHELSEERRSRRISGIAREDLTEEILEKNCVCEKHFLSEEQLRAGINIILTGFRHGFFF